MIKSFLAAILLFLATLPVGRAEDAPARAQTIFGNLMNSVQTGNYQGMLIGGSEAFQKGLTQEMAAKVSAQLSPRMQEGYSAQYLTSMHQAVYEVYLWKLSFRDGKDDLLAKVMIDKDSRVAGFWID
ncbi:hypothetical protein BH09VER1_BH09VER1_14580 [soil metagenome]